MRVFLSFLLVLITLGPGFAQAPAPVVPEESSATGYSTPLLLGFGFAAAGVVMFWVRRRRRRAANRDSGGRN